MSEVILAMVILAKAFYLYKIQFWGPDAYGIARHLFVLFQQIGFSTEAIHYLQSNYH